MAKEFAKYMIQPKVLNEYLKAGLGRWALPIPEIVKSDPFWLKEDPHRTAYMPQLTVIGPTYADLRGVQPGDRAGRRRACLQTSPCSMS